MCLVHVCVSLALSCPRRLMIKPEKDETPHLSSLHTYTSLHLLHSLSCLPFYFYSCLSFSHIWLRSSRGTAEQATLAPLRRCITGRLCNTLHFYAQLTIEHSHFDICRESLETLLADLKSSPNPNPLMQLKTNTKGKIKSLQTVIYYILFI